MLIRGPQTTELFWRRGSSRAVPSFAYERGHKNPLRENECDDFRYEFFHSLARRPSLSGGLL